MPKKSTKRNRSPKGEISIAVNDGKLRLRIPAKNFSNRNQKFLALRLEDTKANRLKAEGLIPEVLNH